MASGTLRELWERELYDLYSTEQKIIGALPELISAAGSPELKAALDKHLQRTRVHVERLDLIFHQCGFGTGGLQASGIESIVRAGAERVKINGDTDVRDAAIIAAAQHVEHYEIAGYGCARTWARQLGDDRSADLLQQTLDEEGAANKQLTDLAESGINESASAGARGQEQRFGSRLRYVDVDDLAAADQYRDTTIHNRTGDDLGKVDGFLVDVSGRPYYVVVDSGGLFVGRRYVVPIGRVDFRRADRLFTIDLDKDLLKRYPEFHRDAFVAMSDEEARRYEWRVLEAIDPQAARASTREWDYDRYPYFRQPDWFDQTAVTRTTGTSAASARTGRTRQVPVVDREERERVIAREERSGEVPISERERLRGRGPDER
jgi:ferritin-like metal-binding protein YciE